MTNSDICFEPLELLINDRQRLNMSTSQRRLLAGTGIKVDMIDHTIDSDGATVCIECRVKHIQLVTSSAVEKRTPYGSTRAAASLLSNRPSNEHRDFHPRAGFA